MKKLNQILEESAHLTELFGKKKPKVTEPARFPEKHNNAEWIEHKIAHARAKNPKEAHHLFNPHSGDYLPNAIAAGHSFSDKAKSEYHAAREKHHDLVKKAMDHNAKRGVEQQVSTSRVHGHPDDFKHLH